MAIAEEAEKGSHGEGGGGRGASTGSQRGADTSPPKKAGRGGGIKRLGQRTDFVLESPISLYHYYYCFSHHKLQEIFYTSTEKTRSGAFKTFFHIKELEGQDS